MINVDIWGSCVSRDSIKIGGDDADFKVLNY